jgi:hypothetical protein
MLVFDERLTVGHHAPPRDAKLLCREPPRRRLAIPIGPRNDNRGPRNCGRVSACDSRGKPPARRL